MSIFSIDLQTFNQQLADPALGRTTKTKICSPEKSMPNDVIFNIEQETILSEKDDEKPTMPDHDIRED